MATSKRILQWEIWDVEWPHEDGTSKRRPALVVSSSEFNGRNDVIWCAKISSRIHEVPFRVELSPGDPSFSATGLNKTSYFYLADVRKVSKRAFYSQRGHVSTLFGMLIVLEIQKAANWTPP